MNMKYRLRFTANLNYVQVRADADGCPGKTQASRGVCMKMEGRRGMRYIPAARKLDPEEVIAFQKDAMKVEGALNGLNNKDRDDLMAVVATSLSVSAEQHPARRGHTTHRSEDQGGLMQNDEWSPRTPSVPSTESSETSAVCDMDFIRSPAKKVISYMQTDIVHVYFVKHFQTAREMCLSSQSPLSRSAQVK